MIQPGSMVVSDNPLVAPQVVAVPKFGVPLRDLAPNALGPLMLRVNGEWLLREQWSRPAFPGDVIEWHILPMGGGGNAGASRTVLTLVAMVAIAYFTMGAGAPALAAALGTTAGSATMVGVGMVASFAATALINALIPIQQPSVAGGATASPGAVYNVQTSGNQARLAQPIPVIYGRMQTFPDYAGQPYTEFSENDSYFMAVYCVSQGEVICERLQIDDTSISHFQDVEYEILPPGSLPTLASANVVTAPEVTGQTMETSKYIGGFAACGPTQVAGAIGIDVIFPMGLGLANGSTGDIGDLSATLQVEARTIDDFGTATSGWAVLGTKTKTAATNTPQRVSYKFTLATPRRVEVRVVRTDVRNETNLALHEMTWGGLRAYLDGTPSLSATATHMAIRMRASEQLSGLTSRKVSGIWRRKLRTWSSVGGWSGLTETRNPMWARLDKLTDTSYGDGLADARIDLQTHADLAAIYEQRQDRFDALFDSKVTSIDADRTICMAGRAVPFQRAGVMTVARDQLQTLPVTAYTSRDITPGSMSINYALANETTADGVIVEYFDYRAWDWREILCRAPGVLVPTNAVRQRLMGITGPKQAEREGLYLAAQNVYRRKFPVFTTEMQGLLPAYGSAAIFSPALPGWGQAGDVAFWEPSTLVMGLTEPLVFTPGATHYVSLVRSDGSVTPAIAVTPGPTEYDVILAGAPDFTLDLDNAGQERPKFIFGVDGEHRIMVRILGIRKKGRGSDGAPTIEISTVAEDIRVHQVDLALLPGPGEIQDAVPDEGVPDTGGGGGGSLVLINLVGTTIYAGTIHDYVIDDNSYEDYYPGLTATFTMFNTGLASGQGHDDYQDYDYDFPSQWSLYGALDPLDAAKYEVRATPKRFPTAFTGSAVGTWLSLSTTRSWVMGVMGDDSNKNVTETLKVEIREIATGVVAASANIKMHLGVWGAEYVPPESY